MHGRIEGNLYNRKVIFSLILHRGNTNCLQRYCYTVNLQPYDTYVSNQLLVLHFPCNTRVSLCKYAAFNVILPRREKMDDIQSNINTQLLTLPQLVTISLPCMHIPCPNYCHMLISTLIMTIFLSEINMFKY